MNFSEPFDSMTSGSCEIPAIKLRLFRMGFGCPWSDQRETAFRVVLVGEGCSLLLCLGTRCSTSIFLCALPSTQVLVVCDLLGSIKCCTAPFALGRKQALGFTPASLSVQHHALSWQKGSSFEHKASAICPCETSYLCYFLLPAICKLHYCAVERKIPFPSSPIHACS